MLENIQMTRKPCGWTKTEVYHRVCWNALQPESQEFLKSNLKDLRDKYFETGYPCESNDEFAENQYVLVRMNGLDFLVDTQGYDYARYAAVACCFPKPLN